MAAPRVEKHRLRLMCYRASMRSGRTKTTSFSLDGNTLKNLKALAARRHNGNVSALLAEIATREAKFAAAEAYFEKYGIPPLTPEAIERIEAEWQGGTSPTARDRAPLLVACGFAPSAQSHARAHSAVERRGRVLLLSRVGDHRTRTIDFAPQQLHK